MNRKGNRLTAAWQRVRDLVREIHIQYLSQQYNALLSVGASYEEKVAIWDRLKRAVNSRSEGQVLRMERHQGLR